MQGGEEGPMPLSLSPSFSSYSDSGKLSQIAARVVGELSRQSPPNSDYSEGNSFPWISEGSISHQFHGNSSDSERKELESAYQRDNCKDVEEDYEFEFASICREPEAVAISPADEIFFNGQIRPVYPVFNTDLLLDDSRNGDEQDLEKSKTVKAVRTRRSSLRTLMSKEREPMLSCSSSHADELEGVAPGTYCVWTPKPPETMSSSSSLANCKKSSSAGSSQRWKFRHFRDLLYRSNSTDGHQDVLVFFMPSKKGAEKVAEVTKVDKESSITGDDKVAGKIKTNRVAAAATATAASSTTNGGGEAQSVKKEGTRTSYLPYRQDLVGFLANANSVTKSFRPF